LRSSLLRIAFPIIALSVLITGCDAVPEAGGNDSLLSPQIMTYDSIEGSVLEGSDQDFFMVEMEEGSILFLALEKTDNGGDDLHLQGYNAYREAIGSISFVVSVPGEVKRMASNTTTLGTTVLFVISGTGNYSFRTMKSPFPDGDDPWSDEETELDLGEVSGSVGLLTWEGLSVRDRDHYIVDTSGSDIEISLTKTDPGDGTVRMIASDNYDDWTAESSRYLEEEKVRLSYYSIYGRYVHITVEGDGNYTLGIQEYQAFEDPALIMVIFLFAFLCVPGGLLLIVIGVIAFVLFRLGKDRKREAASFSAPQPPYIPPHPPLSRTPRGPR